MKFIIFIAFIFTVNSSLAQTPKHSFKSKLFINQQLQEIRFSNDSICEVNFLVSTRKLLIKADSAHFKMLEPEEGMKESYSYKIVKINVDSLVFEGPNFNEKVTFIDTARILDSIYNFKKITIDYLEGGNDYSDSRIFRYIITSKKEAFWGIFQKSIPPNESDASKFKSRKLTSEEYGRFIFVLSKSAIFWLPEERLRAMDGPNVRIEILTNNQSICSEGGNLSIVHITLLDFIHAIFEIND